MSNQKTSLAAEARAKAGKGAARAVRRNGRVPAVVYGDNKEPILLSLPRKELVMELAKKTFFTHLCDLDIEGKQHLVLPRDVQLHPVNDTPEHVDFLRVTNKTVIRVFVPVRVKNEKDAPGLVKGGVLNTVRHEIEVFAKATDIPEEFVADLTGMQVGDSLHLEDLKLPTSVEPALEGNFTVLTIVAPSALKSDESTTTGSADGEAAEGEAPAEGDAAEGAPAEAAKDDKGEKK